eukprot:scaffold5463_cov88-Skeletonema_dohrnii-CCMP3373.AAC.1
MPNTALHRIPIHNKASGSPSSSFKALELILMCDIWHLHDVDGSSDMEKLSRIVVGGEYYDTFDGRKSLIISIGVMETCLGASYSDEHDATSHYGAKEPNKLRNPSCRCLR